MVAGLGQAVRKHPVNFLRAKGGLSTTSGYFRALYRAVKAELVFADDDMAEVETLGVVRYSSN